MVDATPARQGSTCVYAVSSLSRWNRVPDMTRVVSVDHSGLRKAFASEGIRESAETLREQRREGRRAAAPRERETGGSRSVRERHQRFLHATSVSHFLTPRLV
ncbi:hypothetical protein MRX96_032629 [Rhipicephalus microplus]